MGIFKCKMCGGELNVNKGDKIVECEFCGTTQTVSTSDDEKILKMIARGNSLRNEGEFDKAYNIFEQIILEGKPDAEVYWNLLLCKYGITYVDDYDGKKKPTINRMSLTSILDDEDYKKVLELADVVTKENYVMQAEQISKIQDNIINIVKNEKPYDIFISYKETDEYGDRTKDSILAQEIYDNLTKEGYKIFLSRICLSSVAGQEYEPYIYSALYSAKIMVLVTTNVDYINAVWVKNEWSRFLNMMKQDQSKKIIPCFKEIDAYDLPKEIRNIQALDMNKLGFIQDLVVGINKIMHKGNTSNTTTPKNDSYVDDAIKSGLELIKNAPLSDIQKDKLQKINEKIFSIDVSNPYYDLFDFVLHSNTKESLETANNIINKNNDEINKKLFDFLLKINQNEFLKLDTVDLNNLDFFNKNFSVNYVNYIYLINKNIDKLNDEEIDELSNLKLNIENDLIKIYNELLEYSLEDKDKIWDYILNIKILHDCFCDFINMDNIYKIGKQMFEKVKPIFESELNCTGHGVDGDFTFEIAAEKIFFALNIISGYKDDEIENNKKNINVTKRYLIDSNHEWFKFKINSDSVEILGDYKRIKISKKDIINITREKTNGINIFSNSTMNMNKTYYYMFEFTFKIDNEFYSTILIKNMHEVILTLNSNIWQFFFKDKIDNKKANEITKNLKYKDTFKKEEDSNNSYNSTNVSSTSTSGCYVATCVYGSYDCPEVWRLRRYRDNYLDEHWWGRAFIKVYYAISPTLVKWFGDKDWFRKPIKRILNKKIDKLAEKGYDDTPYNDKY